MAERAITRNIGLIFRLNNALIKQKNREMAQYDLTLSGRCTYVHTC